MIFLREGLLGTGVYQLKLCVVSSQGGRGKGAKHPQAPAPCGIVVV